MIKRLNICRTTRQVKSFSSIDTSVRPVKFSFIFSHDEFHLASFNFKILPPEGEFPEIINNVNVILSEQMR